MVLKKLIIAVFAFSYLSIVHAQKYYSRNGEISFHASTPLETIDPVSNSASTVLDLESGKVQWAVLVKSFKFHKALMQEHFNENYMESSKIPKATYSGVIENIESLDINKDGTYELIVKGALIIHGVEKTVTSPVQFVVNNGKLSASSSLKVNSADFKIDIPSVVRDKIAKVITINIKADYEILKKG